MAPGVSPQRRQRERIPPTPFSRRCCRCFRRAPVAAGLLPPVALLPLLGVGLGAVAARGCGSGMAGEKRLSPCVLWTLLLGMAVVVASMFSRSASTYCVKCFDFHRFN